MGQRDKVKWDRILAVGGTVVIFLCVVFFIVVYLRENSRQEADAEEPVTITLVYAYQNAQWNQGIQTIVEEFTKIHPDVAVNVQVQYEDKVYEDILFKLQARGEMGDVIQMKTPGRYAREGLLCPIPEEFGALLDEAYRYEEQVYGLLAVGNTNGILYNRDIFERYDRKEPETYGEFLQICDVLRQNGITPVGVAGGNLWHLEFWVNHFFRSDILAKNANFLTDCNAGKASWQDAEAIQMLTHLQQLLEGDYVNADWTVKQDGNLAYSMSQGEVAMAYTGSWTAQEVQKLNPEISLGWFFVPDEEGNRVVLENKDVYWCLTKACGQDEARYQAACTFLEFFYTSEVYSRLCQGIYGFPVTADENRIPEKELQLSDIQFEIREEFFQYPNHQSLYIGNEDTPQGFEKVLLSEIIALGEGKDDVQTAAEKLDAWWQQYRKQEQ